MKSKRRVREPGPLPLPNEKPLWPSFWFSNTSRALHSLSPCLVPSLQGRPFLLKSQIKGLPLQRGLPWPPYTSSDVLYHRTSPFPSMAYSTLGLCIDFFVKCKIYASFIKNISPLPSTVPGTWYSPNRDVFNEHIHPASCLPQGGWLRAGFWGWPRAPDDHISNRSSVFHSPLLSALVFANALTPVLRGIKGAR